MQLMGIAEFIIGRAVARPVGSTHRSAAFAAGAIPKIPLVEISM